MRLIPCKPDGPFTVEDEQEQQTSAHHIINSTARTKFARDHGFVIHQY
jgi:hypothetical protein